MSRTAGYWATLIVTMLLMGVAVIFHATALVLLAGAAMGLSALVFAHGLSEHEGGPSSYLPGSRGTRKVILRVIGALLLVGCAIGAVGQLA